MARFENGWFRFNRRAVFEDIGQNPHCLAIWVWLLASATLRETKIRWHGAQRSLSAGTVVTGFTDLSLHSGIPRTTVIRQLKYLEKTERIRIESGPQGTLITICKWKEYQSDYLEDETQVEQERYASESTNEYTTGSTGETTDESTTGPLLNKEQLTINKEQRTKKSSAQGPNLEMGTPVLRAVEKASPRRGDQGFCLTTETWQAYLEAFSERWQVEPKWNATVGGQLAHFIRRVGREDAPHVARFYMLHDDRGYVKNMHPVGWMLKDAEKLYAEWKSGKQVTQLQAASVEKASNYVSMLKRIEQGAL